VLTGRVGAPGARVVRLVSRLSSASWAGVRWVRVSPDFGLG
jgi:hypothetical protein